MSKTDLKNYPFPLLLLILSQEKSDNLILLKRFSLQLVQGSFFDLGVLSVHCHFLSILWRPGGMLVLCMPASQPNHKAEIIINILLMRKVSEKFTGVSYAMG